MKHTRYKTKREQGNATVVAIMLLAVLTLIGLAVSRIAGIDTQIAGNQIPYKQSFYVAEGGVNREAAEIGRGVYAITDIQTVDPQPEYTHQDHDPLHHVNGEEYPFNINYEGAYVPPAGYSAVHFSRYDYSIEAWSLTDKDAPIESWSDTDEEDVRVRSRYYKIGPKAS